jgi:hypothetical protein
MTRAPEPLDPDAAAAALALAERLRAIMEGHPPTKPPMTAADATVPTSDPMRADDAPAAPSSE